MSVHKKPDGRWVVSYYEKDKEKKRTQVWKYFGRGEDAKQKALDFNYSLGLGKKRRKARGPVFGDLVVDYLKAKKNLIAKTTFRSSYARFTKNILPILGNLPAITLTPNIIDDFVTKRLEQVKRSSVRAELGNIITVLNFAVSRGRLSHNPLVGYRKPKPDDERINPPTLDKINSILEHARPHLQRVIMICAFTGIRAGQKELFRLKYKDIDLTEGIITVKSASKGGLKYRTIPLHKEFKKALMQWIEVDGIDKELHIIRYAGKPIKDVSRAWRAAKKAAGIKRRLRLYDLRHFWATHLLTHGGDLRTVSRALGHANPAITLQVYSHASSDVLKKAVDSLPDFEIKAPKKPAQVVRLKNGR